MPLTLTRLLRHLHSHTAPHEKDSDADLLERFARHRDEDAFTALVVRHGPMVLNVCRRVLGDAHIAEDAFQAAFLVLARKAASLRRPAALAPWLYGVASRVARKARRRAYSGPRPLPSIPELPDPHLDPLAELTARDLLTVLEDEVQLLPESYRLPVVLCCLEGLSQEETAQRLGCTTGSVKGRLERGRKRLHAQLARRGLTLSVALGAADVARGLASVTAPLFASTTRAALLFVTGQTAGAKAAPAFALAEGVLRMMRLQKFGPVAILFLLASALLTAGVFLHSPLPASHAGEDFKAAPAPRQDAKPLWAGLSVNRPVFQEGGTGELQVTFTLVNDADKVIDPRVGSAKIIVNGKVLADSAFILGNGPRDARFGALPPGDHLLFGYALGKHFERPGVYRVSWEGERFRSADVVFRVLPKPAKPEGARQDRTRPGEMIEGVVERVVNEGSGDALLLNTGVRVGVDEKTEYLAETGLDARPITQREVLGRNVYASVAKRDRRMVASVVVVTLLQPDQPKPQPKPADRELKRIRAALEGVLEQTKQDKHLKPRDGQIVRVEEDGTEVSLRYETPDRWPDLPSKPVGPRPGHGSVQVRVLRGPAKTGLDAPFVPPARCCYALSVYGTSVAGLQVSLWSMTSDRAAHGRLEGVVRGRLRAAGIEMNARPVAAPIRAGLESEGPPPGDGQAGRVGQP